ncbi:MAG: VWA domain-containing protein [Planctomycetota bacterium]|nr:MAG: VWA domain-containing protein [Planctomycetota bacterium]REJ95647.1 MAG: VWA domain-containing protein [Planctomycetota bacterium]REK29158.1 MAG: VWA domain-containing protein [Planctomycetota bacterium]REK46948.1 MAG: VWA domain-containing protein [Planctomycetota bacterium]
MDWLNPYLLLLVLPVLPLLWWFSRRSLRPMPPGRKRALLVVRGLLILLALAALAGPARQELSRQQAVIFLFDHSQSQGAQGIERARERAEQLVESLPSGTHIGFLSAGADTHVLRLPSADRDLPEIEERLSEENGGRSDLAAAVTLAGGLFPPGASRRIVYLGDGQQTHGDLEAAVREASLLGTVFDVVPVAGERRADVRVIDLAADRSRSHEGAALELRAEVESSLAGTGRIRLFENGVEVAAKPLELEVGERVTEVFRRSPEERNLYTYQVRVEGFAADEIAENDAAMTLVDVRGRPLVLYIEGEPGEAHYLADAMASEGLRLQIRSPENFPRAMRELAGYDGVVLSDVPAHKLNERSMTLLRDYVEQLGGGFVMVGGKNSFGVGGYYRTPIEEVLPVKMKAPDTEQRFATALCLVIDRSGSMGGQKIEICKSAAVATVDLLSKKDYISVISFDSSARVVVPSTRISNKDDIKNLVATLNAGGGTNMFPGMSAGREQLRKIKAKIKHMIVLTDGHTGGDGYQQLAAQMKAEGMTLSAVAVGQSANSPMLQTIAAVGGGKFYVTVDPSNIPQIFTQDAMTHMGKLIRERPFAARQVERHVMLKGCPIAEAPSLLGYVKTNRKQTAQVPLVTDQGDPLLAHWQYGLGKVTAFTSDCKSRWAALWLSSWSNYQQFWSQLLRETVREPQGHFMDIQVERDGDRSVVNVDLLQDAATFKNSAEVTADIYFVPAGSLGSSLQKLAGKTLRQTGPGRYTTHFSPREPGVYLVRARSGAAIVSAGQVHQVSGEAATGRVNERLLAKATKIGGGRLLADSDERLTEIRGTHSRYVELMPLLLRLFLLLFLADVVIRRWENLQGFWMLVRGRE